MGYFFFFLSQIRRNFYKSTDLLIIYVMVPTEKWLAVCSQSKLISVTLLQIEKLLF